MESPNQFNTMRTFIKTFLGLSLILFVDSQDYQRCYLRNRSIGICKHVFECSSVKNELQQGLRPRLCGYSGRYPIVCCDQNKIQGISNRISEEKCQEYLKLDIKTTIKSATTPTESMEDVVHAFIIGGENAYFEEYPHMAILGYGPLENIEFKCGGSLISEQFILTAAHCLQSQNGPVSLIRLGELDLASETEHAEPQDFNVLKTFTHPQYDFESFYHDIALIKLDRPVIYTKYVKPACLESKLEFEYNNLTITGWGATEYGGGFHSYLQKAYLYNLPALNCTRSYRPQSGLENGFDEELQLCGGNPKSNADTCQGDSGGPIQAKIQYLPQMYRIVGVTSFGNNCGLIPGVYTKVSKYISWIESIVWPN
ncbi:venom protease-like [Onthophagus taurus]|uniref:venom protease-like n=1 Tax=Onthophagus taurus TaxID=166361 RepID=UPI0039BDC3DA